VHFLAGDEERTDCIRADNILAGCNGAGAYSGSLPDASQIQNTPSLRPFRSDGLRSADLPGELARNRDMSECATFFGLPHRHWWPSDPDQSCLHQRSLRLASFLRRRRALDASRTKTFRRQPGGTWTGSRLVRPGCHGNRAEHVFVSVGTMEAILGLGQA